MDLDSDPKDSDLDSDFAHETKVKAIHELLVNDWSQEKFVFPSRAYNSLLTDLLTEDLQDDTLERTMAVASMKLLHNSE